MKESSRRRKPGPDSTLALNSLHRPGPGEEQSRPRRAALHDLPPRTRAREPSRRGGDGEGDWPHQPRRVARADGANRRKGTAPARPLRGALANELLAGARSNDRRDCARHRQPGRVSRSGREGGLVSPAGVGLKKKSRAIPQAPLSAPKAKRRLAVSQGTPRLEDLVTRRRRAVIVSRARRWPPPHRSHRYPRKNGAGCFCSWSGRSSGNIPFPGAPGSISSRCTQSPGIEPRCHGPGGPSSYGGRKTRTGTPWRRNREPGLGRRCLRQADGPPAQGRGIGVPRLE